MSYQISIKQGDLLKEDNATFIVNASNTRLILGSGGYLWLLKGIVA